MASGERTAGDAVGSLAGAPSEPHTGAVRERQTRRAERANAWLSALLLVAAVVLANDLARRHLVRRFDLSEDRLYTISDATRRVLDRLQDRLQVTAYFSGEIQNGELALAKARLEGLLSEYEALAQSRLVVRTADPLGSSRVLLEARELGLTPYPVTTVRGAVQIAEEVYLGLVLRYRGREAVIPLALPGTFESVLTSRIHELLRERPAVVGWYGSDPESLEDPEAEWGTFTEARALLSRTRDVRRIERLASGVPVPDDVDVLLVVRPRELHPRAAFELDQYAQRGGRLVVLVDEVAMSFARGEARSAATGLEALLRAWGAPVTPQHVWDASHGALPVTRRVVLPSPSGPKEELARVDVPYPLFVRLEPEGFDEELPPTAELQDGVLCWAQPIAPVEPPEGVRRDFLVRSSEDAYRVDLAERIVADEDVLEAETQRLVAQGSGRRYDLGVALSGRFPSPFEAGAPPPLDPFAEGDDARAGTTDEPVLSRAAETQVVVFGDADWIRDRFVGANARLFQNVVDWLTLDPELVAMRSRVPRDRPIADFLEQERERLGLEGGGVPRTGEQAERRRELEEQARRAANVRQWRIVLVPVAASAALVAVLGLAFSRAGRRGGGA